MERHVQLDWSALVDAAVSRRLREHITQKQVAALAGVSIPTVIRFEAGDERMNLAAALAILRALGMAAVPVDASRANPTRNP